MKIQRFQDTDTLYIELCATEIVETRDFAENTLIDLDSEGNPASSSPSAPARLRIPAFSYEQIPA
jgi:hypothetical protein